MPAVLGALTANGLITVLKFIAAVSTGSSGMMAESLRSLADTANRVFLLPGLRFYKRPASEKHPFGYGEERFFRSLRRHQSPVVRGQLLLRCITRTLIFRRTLARDMNDWQLQLTTDN